jgi:predicted DNA-binding protein YlxM (UPF0122 family)
MKKIFRIAKLLDNYGPLLTKRQQTFLRLYYEEDLSLGEIATEYKISRQAVYDIIRRAEALLGEWDQKLNLVERGEKQQQNLVEALRLVAQIKAKVKDQEAEALLNRLKSLLATFSEI